MKAFKIVSSSISLVSEKFLVFFTMIFPVIIFETLWHISGGLHTDGIITIGSIGIIIFFVLMTIYGIKAVVGIHRFIILNENYSYSITKDGSIIIKIALFGFIISIIAVVPITTNPIWLIYLSSYPVLSIVLLVLAFFFAFLFISSLSLGFPLIAIGENKSAFNLLSIFRLAKGYRLLLFFQFLMIMLPYVFLITLANTFINNLLFVTVLNILLKAYATILLVCSISNTYLLWKDKN